MNERCTFKDGQNSVRKVVDTAGSVVASYDYTAFGEVLNQSQPSGWIFNHRAFGEIYDPNLGMTYLRARWMDPASGRFESRDPFPGLVAKPLSLHRFGYGANDPVNQLDPGGDFLVSLLVATLIVGLAATVAAAASPSVVQGTPAVTVPVDLWVAPGVDPHLAGVYSMKAAKIWKEGGTPSIKVLPLVAKSLSGARWNYIRSDGPCVGCYQWASLQDRSKIEGGPFIDDAIAELYKGRPVAIVTNWVASEQYGFVNGVADDVEGRVCATAVSVRDPARAAKGAIAQTLTNTMAHELGHLFSLRDGPSGPGITASNLMAQPAKGDDLIQDQRQQVLDFLRNDRASWIQ